MILAHALPDGVAAFPLAVVLIGLVTAHLALVGVLLRRPHPVMAEGVVTLPTASGDRVRGEGVGGLGGRTRSTPIGHMIGVGVFALVVVLAAFGSPVASRNFADVAVLSLLWGCVAVASALLGPVWRRVDPLWGIAMLLHGGRLPDGGREGGPAPEAAPGAGVRSALAASLLVWAWAQLLWRPGRDAFLVALLGYSLVHTTLAARRGRAWLLDAEALHAMSGTLGLLRPGRAVASLVAARQQPAPQLIAAVLIGWGLLDLVVERTWWTGLELTADITWWLGPLLLVALCGAVAALLRGVLGQRFGIVAVPLAAGWVVAQHVPRIVLQGQGLLVWLSDPLATGADLLGTGGRLVDPLGVAPLAVVAVQVAAFLAGHVLAAVTTSHLAVSGGARGSLSAATLAPRVLVLASLAGGAYLQMAGL